MRQIIKFYGIVANNDGSMPMLTREELNIRLAKEEANMGKTLRLCPTCNGQSHIDEPYYDEELHVKVYPTCPDCSGWPYIE